MNLRIPRIPFLLVPLLMAVAATSGSAAEPSPPIPAENPLRAADDATRSRALSDAWETYQRACRPCHGSVGAADGPYATTFAEPAADLRRPSSAIAGDATRFRRIRDGAGSRTDRPWLSSMPAFGDDLKDEQIWGLVLLLQQLGQPGTGFSEDTPPADVYQARCAVCHGTDGKGDGPLAAELTPPPRNFVTAEYHLRTTLPGSPPLDTDVIGVIARGMGDTAMGRFTPLGVQTLEDLAGHLRTFAPNVFAAESKAMPPTGMPMDPPDKLAAEGRQVYDEAGCADCHGKYRRGDGPSALNPKGEGGRPSFATDLTKRWEIRGGGGISDMYRTITTGMAGTAMAGYVDKLSDQQRWAVAFFLERQMQTRPRFPVNVHAVSVDGALPTDPSSPAWSTIPAVSVPLGPQVEVAPYWTQPSIDAIDVTVATKGKQVAILLVWNDRTRDAQSQDTEATDLVTAIARRGSWRLPDRVAVQFPASIVAKGPVPPPYLGDDAHPVTRWVWSADRSDSTALVERVAGPRATPAAVAGATVTTTAAFADGQWRVVLTGELPAAPKGASIPIAIQAWDGAAGETGVRQSFSGWLGLTR
jgi:DMSO reductase family type II enzyme heme b subunit